MRKRVTNLVARFARRAQVFEVIGKHEMAMQALLSVEPNHGDVLDIHWRLRMPIVALENGPDVKTRLLRVSLKLPNGTSKHNENPLKAGVIEQPLASFPERKALEEIVSKRFPSSKSVLIKYKDSDKDLVTITSTNKLKVAEDYVDNFLTKDPKCDKAGSYGTNFGLEFVEIEICKIDTKAIREVPKEKAEASKDIECKEMEMNDWLFEFDHLFRTCFAIDPNAHIDLHKLGVELCSDAFEETVTSEDAEVLFEAAALKFQEVAVLAFSNWGNVHVCVARKRIPLDD
ncbi:hypothetical protein Ancab_033424 [Ancistrocladus abbreviatus]